MTIMVTGASGPVGHALVPLLARRDEVRAAIRDPVAAEPLRALGAKVTLGRLDDADDLTEVLRGVFTLVHLVGGPDQPDDHALFDANHGSTVRAVAAAREAGVKRIVFVSVPAASPESAVPYLRAKGLAEEVVVTSGLQHAVIRSAPVVGAGSLWFVATVAGALQAPPIAWGQGRRSVAPVAVGDLAAAIAVADDLDGDLAGTWALEGPDSVTTDDVLAVLAGPDATPEHLEDGAARSRLSALLARQVSMHVVDALTAPGRADAPDAAERFGISLTPFDESVRAALVSVATADARGR
jgi:uncharacterized protein YbjT (DUF2867 family)